MKAAILTIGDEILNGQTVDTNASWIARQLNLIGIDIRIKLSVSDEHDEIKRGLQLGTDMADIVIMTGGLGPTKDDITKVAIADFIGDELVFSNHLYEHICDYFEGRGREVLPAHRAQSVVPARAELLDNPRGTALGMWMKWRGKYLLSMPGVPSEMKIIMEKVAIDKIAALVPDQHIEHYIIQTAGVGETQLATAIEDIVENMPTGLSMAYLPATASVKLRLTGRGSNHDQVKQQTNTYGQRIQERVAQHVYATGNVTLTQSLQQLCIDKGVSIGTAESCTGGGVGRAIVATPGSSAYYHGGIVAYSNDIKESILGVQAGTLQKHGAVSEQCVREMVVGAVHALSVDCAVAISGIAGPDGGTSEKPVGTIWIAVGTATEQRAMQIRYKKDREMNIRYAIVSALYQLRLYVADKF